MNKLHAFAFYALVTPVVTLGAGSVLAEQSTDQDVEQYGSHPAVESDQHDQDVKQFTSDESSHRAKDSGSHPAEESAQHDQDARKPTSRTGQSDQSKQHTSQSDSHPAVENAQHDQDARKPTSRTGQSDQSEQHANQSDSHPAVENSQRDKSRRVYMESAMANGMQASDLIGAKVSTSSDEKVGSVRNLIIDENGQVVAIVVGAGGFLGLGEKDVAIGWDDVTRSNSSGEQELRINMTSEELRSAPKFEMQMQD